MLASGCACSRDHRQELPFCGVIQGQYIAWERTVYVQTPIDKLPQARLRFRNRIALVCIPACRAYARSRASPCSLSSGTTRTRASEWPSPLININTAFPFSRRGRRRYMSTKCWSMLEEVRHRSPARGVVA